ncbi:MAG: DNA-directed RNA polymerase subunit omega [Gloeomargarita sp. SKYG116]|nr:DNA-directed RNA polymerase subunit omega [Gloeomargarita sp. SKYG116]MCS7226704.1 DNA-directed RNA polymerase subunit omega [Gloeomargarita sp. SKYB31]MDW8400137.1 DNA-directed RNA polymerase subunit omega [Gloeomargarita sp. SKYGB_i_bin116]
MIQRRHRIDPVEVLFRTEELLRDARNRYEITHQVALCAKRCRYEDIDPLDDPFNKPVIRAIIEMAEKLKPELVGGEHLPETLG